MNALLSSFVRYWVAAPMVAVVLVAACGASRVNAENYQKIENGMTRDEVHDLLGKPDEVSGAGIGKLQMASEVWRGHKESIHVSFVNDKVQLKSIGAE